MDTFEEPSPLEIASKKMDMVMIGRTLQNWDVGADGLTLFFADGGTVELRTNYVDGEFGVDVEVQQLPPMLREYLEEREPNTGACAFRLQNDPETDPD